MITKESIIRELTPRYNDYYRGFKGIIVEDKGVFAIRDAKVEGDGTRWSIFRLGDGLLGNTVCSHLTLKQINMLSQYFITLKEGCE